MTTETKPLTHPDAIALANELMNARDIESINICQHIVTERLALIAERDAAMREADRLRHGVPVEGDFVCPNELRATEAEAERDEALALLERFAVDVVTFREWSGMKPEARMRGGVTQDAWDARALLAKTEGRR